MSDAGNKALDAATHEIARADAVLERAERTIVRRGRRKAQSPIVDASTDPRHAVCLSVAAEYLEMNERTLRARIDAGLVHAHIDGKIYRVLMSSIRAYEQRLAS